MPVISDAAILASSSNSARSRLTLGCILKPDFKRLAKRFLRWRARLKKPKPKFRQILADKMKRGTAKPR